MDYQFAFRAGELDRAAQLRGADGGRSDARAKTLVFWRGKLLADAAARPATVPLAHPALADTREPPLFVGLTPDGPVFAADLALWSPLEDATTIGEFIDRSEQKHPGFAEAKFVEIRGLMPSLTRLDGECIATGRALIGWHAVHRFCANCGTPTHRRRERRLGAQMPAMRHAAFSAYRPGSHHGDRRGVRTCCSAAARPGRSGCIRCSPGSSSRAKRSRQPSGAKRWKKAPFRSARCAMSPASHGRSRCR